MPLNTLLSRSAKGSPRDCRFRSSQFSRRNRKAPRELAKPESHGRISLATRPIASEGLPSHVLDGQSHAHASADAEGSKSAAAFAAQQFVEERDGDARAGAPDGVTKSDRSSVDIEAVAIEVKLAVAGQDLGGERFVEFDKIEVGEVERVFLLELAESRDGADPHDARVDSGGCH